MSEDSGIINRNIEGGIRNPGVDGGLQNDNYNPGDSGPVSWGGYGYGYGGGGGGGGKSAEEAQEETQAQIDNTAANYDKRGTDLGKQAEQNLGSLKTQLSQNQALYDANRRQAMQQVEWQPNQQKEQSTLETLRNRMGNSAYGSGLVDVMEGLARVDDMNDVQLINAWKQNSNAAYDNWFQANEDLIADYVEQVSAIQDEYSKLYSQYWSTLSNINPLLASKENIEKSSRGEESEHGEDTDHYTLPGAPGILASEALRELYTIPERASAVNPYTKDYVRPDRAVASANAIRDTGQADRSMAANQGYLDNLGVYRRHPANEPDRMQPTVKPTTAIEWPTSTMPSQSSSNTPSPSTSIITERIRDLLSRYQKPSSERSERSEQIVSNLRSIASDFIDEQKRKTPVSSFAEEIRRAVDRANSAS